MFIIVCACTHGGVYFPRPKVTYHSSGATAGAGAGVYESDPTATDGPGLYADPKAIEHQVAGPGGEEYALVTTKKKQVCMYVVWELVAMATRSVLNTPGCH